MKWVNADEQLPPPQSTVLAFVPNYGAGFSRRVRAVWVAPLSIEADLDYYLEEDCDESDDGTFYLRAGWFEDPVYCEQQERIPDTVTHWMQLPAEPAR